MIKYLREHFDTEEEYLEYRKKANARNKKYYNTEKGRTRKSEYQKNEGKAFHRAACKKYYDSEHGKEKIRALNYDEHHREIHYKAAKKYSESKKGIEKNNSPEYKAKHRYSKWGTPERAEVSRIIHRDRSRLIDLGLVKRGDGKVVLHYKYISDDEDKNWMNYIEITDVKGQADFKWNNKDFKRVLVMPDGKEIEYLN